MGDAHTVAPRRRRRRRRRKTRMKRRRKIRRRRRRRRFNVGRVLVLNNPPAIVLHSFRVVASLERRVPLDLELLLRRGPGAGGRRGLVLVRRPIHLRFDDGWERLGYDRPPLARRVLGPGRYCSSRHRTPFYSTHAGSKRG
jgi:hypothetical protein